MVRQITLARARRSEDKFIPIRDDAALHRKVRDVQMEGYARQAVGHLDSEGRERRAVVGLPVEKAEGLIEEGVETLLGGKVGLVAGNRRPEQHRNVHRVMTRRAAHKGQLRPYVVADALQLRFALGPRHDVAVTAYGAQPLRMRLIEIHFDPLPVDGVRARIGRQRVHVPGRGFETLERFVVVVEEDHLIVDMVAGEQQPHGRREREAAVRAVGREAFVAEIRRHALRQHVQIGERVHREVLVPDAHHVRVETDILVYDRKPFVREGEVTGQQPRIIRRADDLGFRKPLDAHEARIVQNAFHLLRSFQKARHGIRVAHLPRDDEAPAQHGRGTGLSHPLGRGLRNEQVARMAQVGPLVEMTLVGTREKAPLGAVVQSLVSLLDKEILLVDDRVIRQHSQGFEPCTVQRFVLLAREGEEFGQRDAVSRGDVGELGDDAVVLDAQQREFRFQGRGFQGSAHRITVLRFEGYECVAAAGWPDDG